MRPNAKCKPVRQFTHMGGFQLVQDNSAVSCLCNNAFAALHQKNIYFFTHCIVYVNASAMDKPERHTKKSF